MNKDVDIDDLYSQTEIVIHNKFNLSGVYSSASTIKAAVISTNDVEVLYHYNSEPSASKNIFYDYKINVGFDSLPKGKDAEIHFISRSAIHNRCDSSDSNKNANGFFAVFSTPLTKGETFSYNYEQEYYIGDVAWAKGGYPVGQKDYRFLRETINYKRILEFPYELYCDVEPETFLLDSEKKKSINHPISLTKNIANDMIQWVITINNPPVGAVHRIKWVKPKI